MGLPLVFCRSLARFTVVIASVVVSTSWGEPAHGREAERAWTLPVLGAADSANLGFSRSRSQLPTSDRPEPFPRQNDASYSGVWREIRSGGPTGRDTPSITYDPQEDRLILFGGYDRSSWLHDLWEFRLGEDSRWVPLAATGEPPPSRCNHTAIYDPLRQRLVIFGGHRDGMVLDDCWELTLGAEPRWRRIEPMGSLPPARAGHVAILDASHDRMIVYGGDNGQYPLQTRGDVWSLSLSEPTAWTQESPLPASVPTLAGWTTATEGDTVPAPRTIPAVAFDSSRNRVIVHGGAGGWGPPVLLADLWALDLDLPMRWERLDASGVGPSPRDGHSAVYDAAGDRLVMFGGNAPLGRVREVWELPLGALEWNLRPSAPDGPTPRFMQAECLDPVRQRMIVFGGIEAPSWRGDTWAYDLASNSWNLAIEETPIPDGRAFPAFAYDRTRDRMLIFGGTAFGLAGDDAWGYSLADGQWSRIITTGPTPPGRSGAVAVIDPVRDRLVVFGGRGPEGGPPMADVWALSLGSDPRWTPIQTTGTPPSPRSCSAAVYDPAQDRMIVYGGFTRIWDPYDEQWREYSAWDGFALSLGENPSWSSLATGPARSEMGCVWDPTRHRMIIAAGVNDDEYEAVPSSDLWGATLDEPFAWSLIEPSRLDPMPRRGASLVLDPLLDRLLLFGGDAGNEMNDVWSYSPSSGQWSSILTAVSPPARLAHAAIWDETRSRMIVFGGWGSSGLHDVWQLNAESGLLDVPAPGAAAIEVGVANPARGGHISVEFATRGAAEPARIDLLDVAGRVVTTRSVPVSGPGRQHTELAGARRLVPGLYFVRVTHGGRTATRKVCVLN